MMQKHYQKACESIEKQTLYVVATPIGNLADISLRALAVLANADIICAEDTRVTAQLLSAYGIQGKLLSVREHNERQMADKIIALLQQGCSIAQVSDAGTPAVCDPGAKLVSLVRAAGYRIVPVAGASAVMAALSAAGITQPDFYFYGFLPAQSGARKKLLERWSETDYPVVMFETPHRIAAVLDEMAVLFPQRQIILAREISKTFENILSGSVAEIRQTLRTDANQSRGEMVLVLQAQTTGPSEAIPEEAQKIMKILVSELPTKQAAALAAQITGENKKALYDLALKWKENS